VLLRSCIAKLDQLSMHYILFAIGKECQVTSAAGAAAAASSVGGDADGLTGAVLSIPGTAKAACSSAACWATAAAATAASFCAMILRASSAALLFARALFVAPMHL